MTTREWVDRWIRMTEAERKAELVQKDLYPHRHAQAVGYAEYNARKARAKKERDRHE